MATGLTFGSITALFGLNHGLLNRTRYTGLISVVILSAFVPTLVAQFRSRPPKSHPTTAAMESLQARLYARALV